MSSSTANRFESHVGGITVTGRAHSLSAWFVLALRLMMGYAFLNAGVSKLVEGGFSAQGYLLNAVPANGGPFVSQLVWLGQNELALAITNVMVPYGQLLIGVALLAGIFTRFAAFWGATMMALFYVANWDIAHGMINGDFAYLLVFLAVAAFGAGRILGLDAIIEQYEVGGQALIERYPILDYVLG